MRIIAFAASPRKDGNTETLLDEVIKGIRQGGVEVKKDLERFFRGEFEVPDFQAQRQFLYRLP